MKGKIGTFYQKLSEYRIQVSSGLPIPALVTGGSSGIGKMIASGLVQNGVNVYIAARKESQLKEASRSRI